MDGQVIIPASRGTEDYVELARTATGVKFRKHILTLGELIHPKTGERLNLDDAWYGKLKSNFDSGVCDIAQVPLANDENKHVEGPLSNAGEVIGIERDGNKVYTVVDIRKPEVVQGLRDRTILGASAFLHMNYTDSRTNQKVGPTLLHHCITNRPYVVGLDPYEEVVAATADGEGDFVILASPEDDMPPTKEELIAALKADHGVDVAALESAAAKGADVAGLTAALTTALQGTPAAQTLQLTGADGQTISGADLVGAIHELASLTRTQGETIDTLRLSNAEAEVDGYIDVGRVLPKQRSAFVKLAMDDRDQLAIMLPDSPVVPLSAPVGTPGRPQGEQRQVEDIDAELARLTNPDGEFSKFFGTEAGKAGSASRRAGVQPRR